MTGRDNLVTDATKTEPLGAITEEKKMNRYESLIGPRLNLNGTSASSLREQYQEVVAALSKVQDALAVATPHGRDYQHDGTGESYRVAARQHIAIREAIAKVQEDWTEIYRSSGL